MKYIVIGAGIIGASAAYHLAKSGAEVILVDRGEVGQATGAAAGIVCPWLSQRRNKAWYTLARNGARFYPSLIAGLEACGEVDTGYKKVGALSIHTDEAKLDEVEKRVRKRHAEAPEIGEINRLSPAQTKALFPLLKEEYYSLHVSGAARVNGKALCHALIQAAKKYGATFISGSAELMMERKRITGIKLANETVWADQVIVTSGAWAKELLAPHQIHFHVEPQKAQIVHLQVEEINTGSWPVIMAPTNQYMLAFEHGHIVVGTVTLGMVGFDIRVNAGGLHDILEKAFMIAPDLVKSELLETKVGFRPVTEGFHPVIGAVPEVEGLLLANGLGATGLTVGPYVGSQLAELALGRKVTIDLTEYDVRKSLTKNERW
ncbi:FAD-binding oxidoreductase [bacterium LRH843]|nr:FAD-binding oxidoreductase [bacterium LRH843]